MAQFDLADATIVVEDGSSPPNKVAVNVSEGAVSFTEHDTMEYTNARNKLHTVRRAPEEPMDVSITALWEDMTSNDPANPTLRDALYFTNSAASWVSSDTDDPCRPPALNLVFYLSPPCGSASSQKITLPNFRKETLTYDGSNSTMQLEGRCLATRAIIEPLVLTISDITFTPTTGVTPGSILNVKWLADYLNAEVRIELKPTTGENIIVGSATASAQTANVRVPSGIASGTYTVVVINGGESSMFAESTASFTIA